MSTRWHSIKNDLQGKVVTHQGSLASITTTYVDAFDVTRWYFYRVDDADMIFGPLATQQEAEEAREEYLEASKDNHERWAAEVT